MPDKTISFKIEDELSDKVKDLIEASGLTAKDWFSKAVSIAEMQSVREGATDYASDLGELEVHTTRIYELVANMVQKSIYLKDHAVSGLTNQLEQQRQLTSDVQLKVKKLTEEKQEAVNKLEISVKEQAEFEKQLAELRETLETKQLLINEYKEKNDVLNGLVTKYQGYAEENEELKTTLEKERNTHRKQLDELLEHDDVQKAEINDLQREMNRLKQAHETALERLEERKEVEKEKALLSLEREHQQARMAANEQYNKKLQDLYEQLAHERKKYEERLTKYEQKIQELQQNNETDER